MQRNSYSRQGTTRRRFLQGAGAVGVGLVGAALTGCGGSRKTTPSAGSGAAPGTSAAGRRNGGTITIGRPPDTDYLTPRYSVRAADTFHYTTIGDTYVYDTAAGGFDKSLGLFASYEFPDPTTLTGRLRPGVKFHDGTPADGAAAKAHLDYLLDPKKSSRFGYRSLINSIAQVNAVDNVNLQLKLSTPDVSLIAGFGSIPGAIFSVASIDKAGDAEILHPIMTGPYKVQSVEVGSQRAYMKNDQYWGPADGPPFADKIVVREIPQPEALAASLETGEVDLGMFNASQTTERLAKSADLQKRSYTGNTDILCLNITRPPLDNLKVRQAIAYAIDKKKVLQTLYSGQGEVAKSIVSPRTYGWRDYDPYPFDPQKARQILQSAGLPLPVKLMYGYYTATGTTTGQQLAAIYQQSLNAAGFDVKLDVSPNQSAWTDSIFQSRTLDIGPFTASTRPDPGSQYAAFVSRNSLYNVSRGTNDPAQAKMDELLLAGLKETDRNAREKIYFDLAQVMLDNVFPQIPITTNQQWVFATKKIGGVDHPEFTNAVDGPTIRPRFLWRVS